MKTKIILVILSVILLASCQSKEEKATETIKEFWYLAQKGLLKADSIYPHYSSPLDTTHPTIAEVTKIGDLQIVSSELKYPSKDTCVVICTNIYHNNSGQQQQDRVKFYVAIGNKTNIITASYGLVQFTSAGRSLLMRTGGLRDDDEDTYTAYNYKNYYEFINALISQYGEAIETIHFKGNEFSDFIDNKVNKENQARINIVKQYTE